MHVLPYTLGWCRNCITPPVLDALGLACHSRAKILTDIQRRDPSNTHQELMMVPIITPNVVEASQAKEALKVAL